MKRLVIVGLIGPLLLIIFPEASAQETYSYELARPSNTVDDINERTESSFGDDVTTVGLGVHIDRYDENHPTYQNNDVLWLRIVATANTREIITYDVSTTSYTWYDVTDPTYITGDDESKWISFAYPVRFYGGRRSAEYNGVYVCSNGFITFDSDPTDRYYGETIPSEDIPNTFIAPFWTDLKPNEGGSITWGYVDAVPGYVISWNNVPNKYGTPQSLQVVIELAPGSPDIYRNSRIWLNYQSITLEDDTTIGIEDQRGLRGVSYNYQDISNGMVLRFRQTSNHAFIQYLTIKVNREGDEYALIDIDEDPDYIRGKNVELTSEEPDPSAKYALALTGAAALLLEATTPWGWVKTAGFILGTTLVGIDIAEVLATSLSPAQVLEIKDDLPNPQTESYIKVEAVNRSFDSFTCVDAEISTIVRWRFTDPNDRDHDLTITAELTYAIFDDTGAQIAWGVISTSVDLNVFIPQYLSISVRGGGTTDPDPGTYAYRYGSSVTVTAYSYPDYTFDYWLLDAEKVYDNPITVMMDSNHTLKAWFTYIGNGNGGGGCPYISTWNGTHYVLDNNLLLASEASNGSNVVDYYLLQQILAQKGDGSYKLLLSEFESEHDFFDYIQLIAVDHSSDVKVAISPYGEILTYTEPSPPVSAIDDKKRNVKHILNAIDGNYYEGYNGSYITLNFGDELDVSNGAKLVMRADVPVKEPWSIHVQIQDEDNSWNTVATLTSRVYWATEIIDMSEHLPDAKGNLKVRLYFTANHKVDFVGLDASLQAAVDIHEGQLISAIHSADGNVTAKLLHSDETYAELVPEQEIQLTFTLPPQTMATRNFIIIAEGHYYTIT